MHEIIACKTEPQLDSCLEMAETQFLKYRQEQRLYDILTLEISNRRKAMESDPYLMCK